MKKLMLAAIIMLAASCSQPEQLKPVKVKRLCKKMYYSEASNELKLYNLGAETFLIDTLFQPGDTVSLDNGYWLVVR